MNDFSPIKINGKTIDQINVGDSAEFTKTITESAVYIYAGVTGDLNPAHVDEVYARKTLFKTRIVHGMLLAVFISGILGTKLPGERTIYVKQELPFLAPVPIGNTVTAHVEVATINHNHNRLMLKTTCINQDGLLVADGKAVVSPLK
jgi:3-hydroxybutyryl-CoA dehydratase